MKYLLTIAFALLICTTQAAAQARIAEIADIEGVRDNEIRGIGLVTGLNGTGDKSVLARRMMVNMLQKMGLNTNPQEMASANMAVVMVTARLDPFKRPGSRLDVVISSIQDAKSLFGGTLDRTLLMGPDNKMVYAVASGPISAAGLEASGQSGSSVTINHPTVASIPNGGLVEKTVPMQILDNRNVVRFHLKNQNFKTATNVAKAINVLFKGAAFAKDAGSIEVTVPTAWRDRLTQFVAKIQDLRVVVDVVSKVVINRKTGVIVAGENVRISKVAVAVGAINITIEEAPQPVIAQPFTEGPSIGALPRSTATISEEQKDLSVLKGGTSVAELAASLNELKLSPNQLISILEEIKSAGALHAEMEIK